MSLIKSISGIRGTIGGKAGDGLNPLDVVIAEACRLFIPQGRENPHLAYRIDLTPH